MFNNNEFLLICSVILLSIIGFIGFLIYMVHADAKRRSDKNIKEYIFSEVAVESAVDNVMHRSAVLLDRSYIRQQMITGFKMYLMLALRYDNKRVMMTSDAVDELWHELLKDKKSYKDMCAKTLGFYLHHIPEESKKVDPNRGIGRLNVENLDQNCRHTLNMINKVFGTLAVPLLTLDRELGNIQGFDYDIGKIVLTKTSGSTGSSCSGSSCGTSCGSSCGSGCGD